MKIYKCQYCKFTATVIKGVKGTKSAKYRMGHHYETQHKELLPQDMNGYRWFYYLLTKKDHGSCIECKKETEFNETTMKYSRYCNNPACKQKYTDMAKQRMIQKYGKVHLLNDPEYQKKMQQGRKIFQWYTWSDGTKFGCLSSYEVHFLNFLDKQLKWPSSDIQWPSPHIYEYEYNGEKHFYMPDGFLTSITCEVEIKDDGSALNINKESREKDKIKDELMLSVHGLFNYIKIAGKNYEPFMQLINQDEI